MTQKKIATFGTPGRTVRVFVEGALVRVQWRELGRRRTESWPDARDNRVRARAFAEGVAAKLDARGRTFEPITLHALYAKYLLAVAPEWRAATLRNTNDHWSLFVGQAGDSRPASDITPEFMDEMRARISRIPAKKRPRSPVQVKRTMDTVRRVVAWAAERQLIPANPLASWRPKLAKDQHAERPGEFTPDEVRRILAQLSRRSAHQWRGWVAVALAATLGRRQRAILNLEWADVDLNARTVTWRADLDKQGREATVPLPRLAVHALRIAKVWGRGSRWVFPPVQSRRGDRPWTYQGAVSMLHAAEQRAGMGVQRLRGFHGFRRGVVTNVHAATGNLELAGALVGDTDVRTLRRSYLTVRPDELKGAADIAGNAVATENHT